MVQLEDITNTLILAGISLEKLEDNQYINSLQNEIISNIPNTDLVQFIILKTFKRILIIFNNKESSVQVYEHFKSTHNDDFKTGYSLHDYASFDINDNYLELPDNSRMFLISPPASPPIDFNYDQVEEEPNKLQIYTHEELNEIFKKNNADLTDLVSENLKKTKYSNNQNSHRSILDFEKEIILNDSNDSSKPRIVLNPINGENDHLIGRAIQSFRTSLPPKSVFDDFDDDIIDDGDYS